MPKIRPDWTARLREWIKNRKTPFDSRELKKAFSAQTKYECKSINWCLKRLAQKGEIDRIGLGRYCYHAGVEPCPRQGRKRKRILKAVYVINRPFSINDIRKLGDAVSKSYVITLLTALAAKNYLVRLSKPGRYPIYFRLIDRERFNRELLQGSKAATLLQNDVREDKA